MSHLSNLPPVDTGTEDLLAWSGDGVGVISLNRPHRRNAFSVDMLSSAAGLIQIFGADEAVRVIMITGEGGAFSAGGDVKAMNESPGGPGDPGSTPESRVDVLRGAQNGLSLALHEIPKPVVAAIDGAAAGAGMSIALAADLRVGSERSFLVPAFVDIGASGDFGGSWFLTRLVGPAKAKELYFWSPRIQASDLLELGLLNEVLPNDGFRELAIDYCQRLARRAPVAMGRIKANIDRAVETDLPAALDAEAEAMIATMGTQDHREAVRAFVEKRSPSFRGH